jgi:predicted nuclease of predicted toxin-antitoxin system
VKGFLIDENLPARFTFAPSLPVISTSRALHRSAEDSDLWEFAREQELAIVTKDADFSDRVLAKRRTPVGRSSATREHAAEGFSRALGPGVAAH